jgi:hypothetical protein
MKNLFSLGLCTFLLVQSPTRAEEKPAAKTDVFIPTKVWKLDLTLSAAEYQAMQPTGGGFFGAPGGGFGAPPAPKPPEKKDPSGRESHKSVFGMDFPIAKGELTEEGKTYKDVAFRYKGNGSYLPSTTKLKRNFKVEFDRFNADQRFHGVKTLNLNAGAADTTKLRESIAYAMYRAAGVPASQTTFAEVTLTVPGKQDKELLGLYTVVEQVDRAFLKNHFKDGKGLLMKPERMRGLDYLGEDWEKYKANYLPKHDATKEQGQRTIEFIKLINRGDDAQFRKEIDSYLDIDLYLKFMAITAMLSNMDSHFSLGHNYYLYLNPVTDKFVFMPWDLDLALAGFPFLFPQEVQIDLSLMRPYPGESKLTDRLMAMKDIAERYQKVLKELATTVFTKERLLREIDSAEMTTKEVLARETKATATRKEPGGFDFAAFGARTPDLRVFAEKRTASIASQLEGKSKGQVPVMGGFGGPRPGGVAGAKPGDILPGPVQDMLRLTPEQRKRLVEIQKSVDEQVEKVLTEEQRSQWKRIREAPPGPPPGKEFPKGARP